jgi:hypothetical protein
VVAVAVALARAQFLGLKWKSPSTNTSSCHFVTVATLLVLRTSTPSLGGCERQTGWWYLTAGQPGTSRTLLKSIRLCSGMGRA